MDKMPVCGTGAPGSIPGGSTNEKLACSQFFCIYTTNLGGNE